jgi:hypothetical protein
MEVSLVFILLIMYLQYVSVTVFKEYVTYLVFFYRSRSYPVPHRGERVKQRMVHACGCSQNCSSCKEPHFCIFLSIASIRIYSMWLLDILFSYVTLL